MNLVRYIMATDVETAKPETTVADLARLMEKADVGSIPVVRDGKLEGIVTDRDIVIRAIAEDRDPQSTPVGEVCTGNPTTLEPSQSVDEAVQAMREHDIRRLPVVQDGRPVGIVSLGDLAVDSDGEKALADISAAPPNN